VTLTYLTCAISRVLAYIDKEIQNSLEEIQEKVNQNFVEKIARLDIDLSYLNGK
jgi:hypothetical protein